MILSYTRQASLRHSEALFSLRFILFPATIPGTGNENKRAIFVIQWKDAAI
jgi:hypothetical protein